MRISRLYSNKPHVFHPIVFNPGFSAVMAEIRLPENRALDTHNLGKTTVGEILDYCLLKSKNNSFFLFRHGDLFAEFVFFLEVQLPDGGFLTIARPVDPGSRVDLVQTETSVPDVSSLPDLNWNHTNLPFGRAKLLLDGILGIDDLKPWGFRKLVGYLIRSQRDYLDVFQLGKFSGKHQDWKPFVAHLLGMDAEPVIDLYNKREEVADAESHLSAIVQEWGSDDVDPSVLDGLISVKRRDVQSKSQVLDSFSFREEDSEKTTDLVERTEFQIAALNEEAYRLTQLLARLEESLAQDKVIFRTEDAEKLFQQAGVSFGEQIKRDYRQLLEFNRAITEERRVVLKDQRAEARLRLDEIGTVLVDLNSERSRSLDFLRETDTLEKYKELSRELTVVQTELASLEGKRDAVARLLDLRRDLRTLKEDYGHLQTEVETQIVTISRNDSSTFGRMRQYFTEIIYEVLGQNALLAIRTNNAGGLEFTAEFIDDGGAATSADRGTSYKKLLCIAFDLALLRTRIDIPFPRFVYHDGAFEQLEPRKREKLIAVLRQYSDLGLQPMVSLLDSDLPSPLGGGQHTLSTDDLVVTLHDEGQDGRLFKMQAW